MTIDTGLHLEYPPNKPQLKALAQAIKLVDDARKQSEELDKEHKTGESY